MLKIEKKHTGYGAGEIRDWPTLLACRTACGKGSKSEFMLKQYCMVKLILRGKRRLVTPISRHVGSNNTNKYQSTQAHALWIFYSSKLSGFCGSCQTSFGESDNFVLHFVYLKWGRICEGQADVLNWGCGHITEGRWQKHEGRERDFRRGCPLQRLFNRIVPLLSLGG